MEKHFATCKRRFRSEISSSNVADGGQMRTDENTRHFLNDPYEHHQSSLDRVLEAHLLFPLMYLLACQTTLLNILSRLTTIGYQFKAASDSGVKKKQLILFNRLISVSELLLLLIFFTQCPICFP